MNNDTPGQPRTVRVLVIGAGFAGVGLGIALDRAGYSDYLILEKGTDVGGCWRDNGYPGAACDVPSHLYSFSFEPNPDWSRRFATQGEIHAYIQHCVRKYHLASRIRLIREAISARFDAAKGYWDVETRCGERYRAQVLVSACGQLSQPAYPAIEGLERFAGPAFHSARWRHDVALAGRRVAVIGTGASAIQFVPPLVPQVAALTLFQRSAAYVIGKPDRAYRPWQRALWRRMPGLQRLDRLRLYLQLEARALAFVTAPVLMKPFGLVFRRHLRRQMPDLHKRAQLVPDYPIGCKRILISNTFYPALADPRVALVTEPIREVVAEGVVTADGRLHPADVLIYGTGFKAHQFVMPLQVTGLDGRDLADTWRDGAEAYKGIGVAGFPNFFLLYGPNTNLGHSSILYMLESQFRYLVDALRTLDEQGLRYLDVRPEAQARFVGRTQRALGRTVWSQGCDSWYLTAAGRNTNNWPGFTFAYRHLTRRLELTDHVCVR